MALTKQEIDKINDVYKQLDTIIAENKFLKETILERLSKIEKLVSEKK